MNGKYKIAVFVGSLRRESINLKLAKAVAKLGQNKFTFAFSALGDLPMYNEDLWSSAPASVAALKKDIIEADAILFVTPEYNRSIPAVLKNAIDWGSRPWGQNTWQGKPVSIIGASPGAIGTAVAQAHLRSVVGILGMTFVEQPEVYIAFKPDLIDANGNIADEGTRKFLQEYIDKFALSMSHLKAAA
jgi:chromate reductase, NAD(P)H dehydrogenase (quinone)